MTLFPFWIVHFPSRSIHLDGSFSYWYVPIQDSFQGHPSLAFWFSCWRRTAQYPSHFPASFSRYWSRFRKCALESEFPGHVIVLSAWFISQVIWCHLAGESFQACQQPWCSRSHDLSLRWFPWDCGSEYHRGLSSCSGSSWHFEADSPSSPKTHSLASRPTFAFRSPKHSFLHEGLRFPSRVSKAQIHEISASFRSPVQGFPFRFWSSLLSLPIISGRRQICHWRS